MADGGGITHLIRCAHILDDVISRVPDSGWDTSTCCDGWTVRDCASHAIGVLVNFRARALGDEPVDINDGQWAGSNPVASCHHYLSRLIDALADINPADVLDHPMFGDLSFDDFYGSLAWDPLIHAWDIADAVGISHGIDDKTARETTDRSSHLAHLVRPEDYAFNPACGDDTLNRLIESTGRTPVRGWPQAVDDGTD